MVCTRAFGGSPEPKLSLRSNSPYPYPPCLVVGQTMSKDKMFLFESSLPPLGEPGNPRAGIAGASAPACLGTAALRELERRWGEFPRVGVSVRKTRRPAEASWLLVGCIHTFRTSSVLELFTGLRNPCCLSCQLQTFVKFL